MTYATYYPDQRHMLPLTLIRRERLLDNGVEGRVEVILNQRVSVKDVIARGPGAADYRVLDGAAFFHLRNPDKLEKLMLVEAGQDVEAGQILAKRGGRKLTTPVTGTVIDIASGRIILQELADTIDLEAGLNGVVVEVRHRRGVVIETYGGVLQGVWGNQRRAIGTLRIEPSTGIEMLAGDTLEIQYRGSIVVTRKPLRALTLDVIEEQAITGVIAPSIAPDLHDRVIRSKAAIMLTQGFGAQRMSSAVYQFLDDLDGRQALLDATMPTGMEARRPEVVIAVPLANDRPGPPLVNLSLQVGSIVRLTRGLSAGATGQITRLPDTPVMMDNGLKVRCAEVSLPSGEKLTVPLANLESPGR